jgi:hypothetical protein
MPYRSCPRRRCRRRIAAFRYPSRVPVHDGDSPEHRWDAREDAAYRRYLADQHLGYREFNSLSAKGAKQLLELARPLSSLEAKAAAPETRGAEMAFKFLASQAHAALRCNL